MTIEQLKDQFALEFNDFMGRIHAIEKKMVQLQKEAEANVQKTADEIEFHKKETKRIEKLSLEADKKNENSQENLKLSQAKLDESSQVLASIRLQEESFRNRQEALSIQESTSIEQKRDADKRLAWAEMEERRLKYLQKKIDLVTQDESIKKKLKDLE